MEDSLALIIGVSEYLRDGIPPLPAAERDAMTLARSFVHWGVPEENLIILLNEEATLQNIATTFKALSLAPPPKRLFLYFVGHGIRKGGENPSSSLQFFDRPIPLEKLIGAMGRLDIEENILIVDACNLRINHFEHPGLQREISGIEEDRRSFFCLLSSGIDLSYEDEKGKYGYFTDALLRGMGKFRKEKYPPEKLVAWIEEDLLKKRLPVPESINMGLRQFPHFGKLSPVLEEGGDVYRREVIAAFQEKLVEGRPPITHLVSGHGRGKSTFAHQLISEKLKIKLVVDPQKLGKVSPYDLLLFDNLPPNQWERVYHLCQTRQVQGILLSEELPFAPGVDPFVWKLPPFSYEESQILIQQHRKPRPEDELLHLAYRGDPKKLKIALAEGVEDPLASFQKRELVLKGLSAILGTGGVMDPSLFATIFNFPIALIEELKVMGWVVEEGEMLFPHPSLYPLIEKDGEHPSKEKTISYWCEQIRRKPKHPLCAKHLLLTLGVFGLEKGVDPYLKHAIHTLLGQGELDLEMVIPIWETLRREKKLTEGALAVAEVLLRMGDFSSSYALLQQSPASSKLLQKAALLQLEFLFRQGKYAECIALANQVQKRRKKEEVLLFLARCYFAVGKWEESADLLLYLIERRKENSAMGFALLLLGKIKAKQGEETLGQGLLEKSIQVFESLGDKQGRALGFLALAEVSLSLSHFSQALAYLEKGIAFGKGVADLDLQGETQKTTLQVELYVEGPRSPQLKRSIDKAYPFLQKRLSHNVEVELLNQLIQVHLARGEYREVLVYLKRLFPRVKDSPHLHQEAQDHFIQFKIRYEKRRANASRDHANPKGDPNYASSLNTRAC